MIYGPVIIWNGMDKVLAPPFMVPLTLIANPIIGGVDVVSKLEYASLTVEGELGIAEVESVAKLGYTSIERVE